MGPKTTLVAAIRRQTAESVRGEIIFITGRPTRKVRLMERSGRVSLCVQDEQPPYKYVSVEGPVLGSHHSTEEERRHVAARYLGREGAEAYLRATPEMAEIEWTFRVRPERWLTQDFSDMAEAIGTQRPAE